MKREVNLFENRHASADSSVSPESSQEQAQPLALRGSKALDMLERVKAEVDEEHHKKLRREKVKNIVEALLFSSSDPLPLKKLKEIIDESYLVKPREILAAVEQLRLEYDVQSKPFELAETAEGYLLRTREEYSPFLHRLFHTRRGEKLSHAATEVLAIIAYRQPITRVQIDQIRGVDSSGALQGLLERELVEPVGRLEAPGRPVLYGVTQHFFSYFGIQDLSQLPSPKDLSA